MSTSAAQMPPSLFFRQQEWRHEKHGSCIQRTTWQIWRTSCMLHICIQKRKASLPLPRTCLRVSCHRDKLVRRWGMHEAVAAPLRRIQRIFVITALA